MRDWTGSQVQRDALLVPCRYCNAQPGAVCTARGEPDRPLAAFPAHTIRISDSQKTAT